MEDSKPPDYTIFTLSLEGIKKFYDLFKNQAEEFIEENSQVNPNNKKEYDLLYGKLFNFYKIILEGTHLDLKSIVTQKKLPYALKRNFSLEVEPIVRDLLGDLEELICSIEEENPYHITTTDIKA